MGNQGIVATLIRYGKKVVEFGKKVVDKFHTQPVRIMTLIWLSLAMLGSFSTRFTFHTEETIFMLFPMLCMLVLLIRSHFRNPGIPFFRENRPYLAGSVVLFLIFLLLLPIWGLLKAPMFSINGLKQIMWHYGISRLLFLFWNWMILLPAMLYSAWFLIFCLLKTSFSENGVLESNRLRSCSGDSIVERSQNQNYRAFLILILTSVACLISAFPSAYDSDAEAIWKGATSMELSDWHTVSYLLFVRLCSRIDTTRFSVTFVQFLLFVCVGCVCILTLNRLEPNGKGKNLFLTLLFIMFTPFFSLHEMTKDVPFSAALLGLTLMMAHIISGRQLRSSQYVVLGFFGYLVLSFRHAGILPFLGAFIPLLLYGLRKKKEIVRGVFLGGCFAILLFFLVARVIAFGVFHAKKNPVYIKYGTPMSVIGSVIYEGKNLRDREIELVERVMPLERWGECFTKYYPGTLSRTYSKIGTDILRVEEEGIGPELTLLAIRLIIRYPLIAGKTIMENASILWRITAPPDQKELSRLIFVLTDHAMDPKDESYTAMTAFTYRISEVFYQTPILKNISRRGGVSVWILIFSGYALYRKRRPEILSFLPVTLLVAGLMISIPSPSTRYVLPLMEIAAYMFPYAMIIPDQPRGS